MCAVCVAGMSTEEGTTAADGIEGAQPTLCLVNQKGPHVRRCQYQEDHQMLTEGEGTEGRLEIGAHFYKNGHEGGGPPSLKRGRM